MRIGLYIKVLPNIFSNKMADNVILEPIDFHCMDKNRHFSK